MRKAIFAGLSVLLLGAAAPAPPVDMSAIPAALAARDAAAGKCSRTHIKSEVAVMRCGLAADKTFATAAKIKDGRLFRVYTANTLRIAADLDAGNNGTGAITQMWEEWWKFLMAVGAEHDAYIARQAAPPTGPAFDPTALPAARARQLAAVKRCRGPNPYVWNSSLYVCLLAANRDFATAIKMRDMYRFETFAALVRVGIHDLDRSGLRPFEMDYFYADLYNRLFAFAGDDFSRY